MKRFTVGYYDANLSNGSFVALEDGQLQHSKQFLELAEIRFLIYFRYAFSVIR